MNKSGGFGTVAGEWIAPRRKFVEPCVPPHDLGKLVDRNTRVFRIRKRDCDGKVGHSEFVAHQIVAAVQMVVQHAAELPDPFLGFGDDRRIRLTHAEERLDEVLEIQGTGMTGEVVRTPAQPAHHFDLPFVAGPDV